MNWSFSARWVLLALALTQAASASVAVEDDQGVRISLPAPAARIVSLAPHATETLFAAGAGDKLVGAVSYSDYPPQAKDIPRVGGYESIDYERVLALEPDLVVAWESGNGAATIERLRSLGLKVYVSEPRALLDVPRALERLGRLAGTAATAEAAAAAFRSKHAALERRYAHQPPVSVFYQVWHQPLITLNGRHLISQTITLCGGRNVFASLSAIAPTVDVEAVLAADPEVIVASGTDASRPPWLDDWRRWGSLTAVKRDNLYFVPPDLIQRHSPRILEGAERLCQQLREARRKR